MLCRPTPLGSTNPVSTRQGLVHDMNSLVLSELRLLASADLAGLKKATDAGQSQVALPFCGDESVCFFW